MSTTGQAFSGTLSLSGTNASDFQIVGTTLQTASALAAANYNINIVATQSGVSGSPFTEPFTLTGSAAAGGPGPVASGTLITANFASNYGQTVLPQAYGWSTGGVGNDGSYLNSHGASGLPTGNFAFFADSTLYTTAGNLNPRIIRFNGDLFAYNGYGTGSDSGPIFNSNGTINSASFANLVTNFYKVNPTNDAWVVLGFNIPGDVITSTTICQECFAALGAYLSTATMGNGQPFPSATGKILFESYNEPDGAVAESSVVAYYNAMYAGIKSVGSSKLLCCAPTTSVLE